MDRLAITHSKFLTSVLAGLRSSPKTLESKWFYDERGSALFEDITRLPEYYPTRTELAILQSHAAELTRFIPANSILVELGSGASRKTRALLDELDKLDAYLPIDISQDFLQATASDLSKDYPALAIEPIVADFMTPVKIHLAYKNHTKTAFFPGSTIGNLEQSSAIDLLRRIHAWDQVSAFIIGIDLVKDPAILVRAYDDSTGVTASFNLNILRRINRELGADFDLAQFEHQARWNAEKSRIEMHLVSLADQTVQLGLMGIEFAIGESIHTENSHKYTPESFSKIANSAGWDIGELFTDQDNLFALAVLVPKTN